MPLSSHSKKLHTPTIDRGLEPHSKFGLDNRPTSTNPHVFRSGFCGEFEARHQSPAERRQGISSLGRRARGACGARARVDGEILSGWHLETSLRGSLCARGSYMISPQQMGWFLYISVNDTCGFYIWYYMILHDIIWYYMICYVKMIHMWSFLCSWSPVPHHGTLEAAFRIQVMARVKWVG